MKTGDYAMKTHDWIIVALLLAVTAFGVLTFFFAPKDAAEAKDVIHALIDALGMVLAFKFGVHVATPAEPPPGTKQASVTITPLEAPNETAPAAPPA